MARSFFGKTLHSVSAFILGDTLVDSGCPATATELSSWCEGRDISRVVHTHHHEDHVGGDHRLALRFGVDIYAPARSAAIMGSFYSLPWYRRLVWGQPEDVTARPFGADVEIGSQRFVTIPTPGHCQDHVCLFDPDRRWIFTGDLFIHERVTHLRVAEDAHTILASLRRVLALEPRLVVCSHAGFVVDACTALENRIRFWEELAEKGRGLTNQGAGLRTVRRQLLGSEGLMLILSGGDFSKGNLIRSLLRSGGEAECIHSR